MVEEEPQWSDAPPQKPKPAVVVERCGEDREGWDGTEHLSTSNTVVNLSPLRSCVYIAVLCEIYKTVTVITQLMLVNLRDVM